VSDKPEWLEGGTQRPGGLGGGDRPGRLFLGELRTIIRRGRAGDLLKWPGLCILMAAPGSIIGLQIFRIVLGMCQNPDGAGCYG